MSLFLDEEFFLYGDIGCKEGGINFKLFIFFYVLLLWDLGIWGIYSIIFYKMLNMIVFE